MCLQKSFIGRIKVLNVLEEALEEVLKQVLKEVLKQEDGLQPGTASSLAAQMLPALNP